MTFLRALFVSLFIALLSTAALAQPPKPPVPNPQAPTLNPVTPFGVQRGGKIELTLTGTNLADPISLWTGFPAKVTIPTDANNGKDQAKLRVVLEVPADAPIGCHGIRLATTRGMSNLRLFCVDDLPPVLEAAGNQAKEKAQVVQSPSVVVGSTAAEVSDYFKISVKAGQRLSFDVLGRRLGGALDPQLTLYDAKTGQDLPGGHSNDAPGLQTDSQLTYTFKEAGDYLIEVRDVLFRGGPEYFYRLRVGEFPCATTPIPLAVQRGIKTTVQFAGPAVEGVAGVEVTAPAEPTVTHLSVAPKGASGLHGWPVSLAVSGSAELVEQEPNNDVAKATRVPFPCGVSGRILDKGDVDHFLFPGKKGQRVVLEAQTVELFSPAEVYLVLKDAKGTQLAASNPAQGAKIDYTPQADADLVLMVEHLHYWHGPSESYRIDIAPYEADFVVSCQLDRWDAPAGGTLAIPVMVTRRGYTGPIDVTVEGHAGLSGKLTVAANQPANPAQPAGTLTIAVKNDIPPGPIFFRLKGTATVDGKAIARTGSVKGAVSASLGNLPYPPPPLETPLALCVKPAPPFILTAKLDGPLTAGAMTMVTVTATRRPGFGDEIGLTLAGLPPTITAMAKNIPAGQNEVKIPLTAAATAPAGPFMVTVTGKAKVDNADVTAAAGPVAIKVEPKK